MTVLCGPAGSRPQAGVQRFVLVGSAAIALALDRAAAGWLRNLIPLLSLPAYETPQLCESDPPGFQPMTAEEVLLATTIGIPIGDVPAARKKLVDNLHTWAWYALCECVSGATPSAPAVTIVAPNPLPLPEVGTPPGSPCHTGVGFTSNIPPGNSFQFATLAAFRGEMVPYPSLAYATFSLSAAVPTGPNCRFELDIFAPAGTLAASVQRTLSPGQSGTLSLAVPPGTELIDLSVFADSGTGVNAVTGQVFSYCGGQLPSTSGCAPDPILYAQIERILELVTLIQRQAVPFAYVPGTRHTGLVGSGQLAVSGLIGLSVIVTTLPPWLGNIAGDPPELFDVGFVTLGTGDGWTKSVRLEHSPHLIFPITAAVTEVGYTLSPGVVVDVLELVREP